MKEIKVHVGWGTAEDRKDVVRSIRQRQVEDKMKLDEEREKHQKKLDNKIKATEKKQEEAKRLVEEKAAEAIILTSEVAGLSQRMTVQPDLSTAQQLTEKTRVLAEAEEAKAWHPVGGTKGRNVTIVTHHAVNVPRNTDSEEIKERVRKINSLFASIADGGVPWIIKKVEPIPHISHKELR